MPIIILEDKKGFKKEVGWHYHLMPVFRLPIYTGPSFGTLNDDAQFAVSPAASVNVLQFYKSQELAPDVWLYKEE